MDIHYPAILQMAFANQPQKLLLLLFGSTMICLIFTLQDFLGRMTKIEDRYWIEIDSLVHSPHSSKPKMTGIKGTEHPYVYAPHTQHPNNPSFSRFEVYPTAQTFCGKPKSDPLYSTQYSDLFVTYTDGFNKHTVQPNPHSMIDEYISGKLVLDTSNSKFVFPALNVSNNFATIDYDAHINTKLTTLLIMFFAQ